MSSFPFPHDLQVHIVADDRFEFAYYSRDKKKYKRTREIGVQTWQDTIGQEIDSSLFWAVVALAERRKVESRGMVGMG